MLDDLKFSSREMTGEEYQVFDNVAHGTHRFIDLISFVLLRTDTPEPERLAVARRVYLSTYSQIWRAFYVAVRAAMPETRAAKERVDAEVATHSPVSVGNCNDLPSDDEIDRMFQQTVIGGE